MEVLLCTRHHDRVRQLHFGLQPAYHVRYVCMFIARRSHYAQQARVSSSGCRYDTNDDYRLDQSEFQRLCADTGRELDSDEAKAALSVIDDNGNGYIEFSEFVRFWVNPKEALGKVHEKLGPGEDEATREPEVAVPKSA